MKLCKLDINNQTLVIIITSNVWAMNFRCTFNNINVHMDTGSYYTLKFDPILLLIKNILCMFFILGFLIEMKIINIFCKKQQNDNNSDLNSDKSTKSKKSTKSNNYNLVNPNDENSVAWLLQQILNYIRIIGPILVVVLSSVDFAVVIVKNDDDSLGKAKKKLINRLLLVAALFLAPTLVSAILDIFGITGEGTCGIS